ncbi:MAG: ABC transporter permease [Chloroflexi bacterium]|nr:ABC transporter permease [Chloroflexota bacterium]MBI3741955.1 ABC transporter permease [Chloroflexota bacterium]
MTFLTNILTAGIANGTALLFATLGELFAERAGVLNLGVEGMMLLGAVMGYSAAYSTGNVWLGILIGVIAGGVLSLLHAYVTIALRADQVVSGLSLTFLGIGLSLVLGEGLAQVKGVPTVPVFSLPLLAQIPFLGAILFENKSALVYLGYFLIPLAWYFIYRTRPGLHLRAIGEYPAAADSLGINVFRLRYFYVLVGGMLAGLAGASLSLSITPGWFSEFTTSGFGWIAIGLVIFAQWDPLRAAVGAYLFGSLRRFILDMQGPPTILFFPNPFFQDRNLQFFLEMLPYALTVIVLVIGSRAALRRRLGAPAALGIPYVRGERGV